jgi:hypothetical protein
MRKVMWEREGYGDGVAKEKTRRSRFVWSHDS